MTVRNTVNTEVFHYLTHGRIGPRPDVERVEGRRVFFSDQSSEVYDLVACGTGFEVCFPFLPEGLVKVKGKVAELTLKQIGDKYQLSRERIRQLQEQALSKMRRQMRDFT